MRKQYIMDRLVSNIYDILIFIISICVIIIGFEYLNKNIINLPNSTKKIVIIIICFLIYLLMFTLIPLLSKGTFGKKLNDLMIKTDVGKLTFGRMLFREVILKHLLYATVIGLIYDVIFYIMKKQTVHDYYLKTVVLKKED